MYKAYYHVSATCQKLLVVLGFLSRFRFSFLCSPYYLPSLGYLSSLTYPPSPTYIPRLHSVTDIVLLGPCFLAKFNISSVLLNLSYFFAL